MARTRSFGVNGRNTDRRSYRMVIISTIIAPPSAAQTFVAQPPKSAPPPLNPLDQRIIAILRQNGRYGLKVWSLLDQVAASHNPTSRAERRSLRLAAWSRLQRLLHVGMAHWFGRKGISLWRLPRLSVRRKRRSASGSTFKGSMEPNCQTPANHLSLRLINEGQDEPPPTGAGAETQSATTANAQPRSEPVHLPEAQHADIRSAAQSLARLPRGVKRRFSGYVGQVRVRIGQPIVVADDTKAFFGGARRGQVLFFLDANRHMERGRWGFVRAAAVRLLKNEWAVALGRAKRGRSERKSELKARTSRANGRLPCGPGKRRGRPRRALVPVL